MLACLRLATRLECDHVIVSSAAERELRWWVHALTITKTLALPLASRLVFPTASSPGSITFYGDASREFDESTGVASASSGWGLWFVAGDIFFYLHGRWSDWECKHFSINLLEAATQLFATRAVIAVTVEQGIECTHVHGFVDNSTAQMVMEKGRSQSDGLNSINMRRHELLSAHGIFSKSSRVASEDNDIADLLSRGDIDEALRIAADSGLQMRELFIESIDRSARNLSTTPTTWA